VRGLRLRTARRGRAPTPARRRLLLAVAAFATLASEVRPAAAVTAVLPAPDGGTIYIAQPRDRQVRVHSAVDGAPIRTIGRDGAGPGEFRGVSRLSWRGDTLVVADMRSSGFRSRARASICARKRSRRLHSPERVGPPSPWRSRRTATRGANRCSISAASRAATRPLHRSCGWPQW
jgi:hypothetical protein